MRSFTLILLPFIILTGFNRKPVIAEVCMTTEEIKLYNMIMEYRKTKKLGAIPLSAKLTLVAQTHAKDLAEHYEFSPKNKCNPHSWSGKGNWTACCYTNDHKKGSCMWDKPREIANYPGNGFEIAYYSSLGASAQEGLDGWKISPGHNPLLINTGTWSNVTWKAIGIGIYKEYGVVWFGEVADDERVESCQ
jgi:hypothetical protein